MLRSSLSERADALVPATTTGLLTTDSMAVLATPLIATVATVEVAGAVAGTVGAATAVGGLATAAVAVAKGDEEEPSAPPVDTAAPGGHVATLLAVRRGR
jgi:hypothetical protein